jgi:hypothetical protein
MSWAGALGSAIGREVARNPNMSEEDKNGLVVSLVVSVVVLFFLAIICKLCMQKKCAEGDEEAGT